MNRTKNNGLRPTERTIPMHAIKYTATAIRRAAAAVFGLKASDLGDTVHVKGILKTARQLAWYLTHRLTRTSYPQIGERYGVNGSTVSAHVAAFDALLRTKKAELKAAREEAFVKCKAAEAWLKTVYAPLPKHLAPQI